ncbi:MAG: ABC-F family ATP-binding cassette domain-containing protein [Bacilli bacterium]|jgi:ATP-binding cassette subfamily F protein 3|nr:ABC-F family ATP-binding cassette domain-containing protein [Bacilli bacterium]
MIILALQNVVKEFNGEALFAPVSFRVDQKERVALIGPNGTGKSTILKMIVGQEEISSGQIIIGKEYRIGYLSQEVISDPSHTLYEEVEEVFLPLKEAEKRIAFLCDQMSKHPDNKDFVASYSQAEAKFAAEGGYDYAYKIDMMLFKFGFKKEDYTRQISTFSGGERMKAAFVKLLLVNPDLLIMDEPTNHLDIDTIEWLEDYLKSYQGSLLFVSHDRYFINALATRILELDQKHMEEYVGDYDHYAKEKQLRYEQQLALYKRQQDEAKKIEWFITYYMPKPRFASRAHDREKKLARLQDQMIDKPTQTHSKLSIDLAGYSRKGKHLIEAEKVSIGYPDKTLVTDINFVLFGGDKLAVMGPNGAGKTTFLKCLLHQLKPLSGELSFYASLSIGYLKQDNMSLSSPETIFAYIKNRFPQMEDQQIYDHLGKYAFSFEDDKKVIDDLSGGERMRVVLAEMVLHNYDLLVLDEPTNHLDMMTKEEFISALNAYQGTLVIVTHDRYFADSVADRLIYFIDGKSYLYEGRYSDFKVQVLDKLEADKEASILQKENKKAEPSQPSYTNEHENKPRPRLSQDKIEEKMSRLENEITELRKHFDEPSYYNDPLKMDSLTAQIKNDEDEYAKLMDMLAIYES